MAAEPTYNKNSLSISFSSNWHQPDHPPHPSIILTQKKINCTIFLSARRYNQAHPHHSISPPPGFLSLEPFYSECLTFWPMISVVVVVGEKGEGWGSSYSAGIPRPTITRSGQFSGHSPRREDHLPLPTLLR
jgi:hypothetical protein